MVTNGTNRLGKYDIIREIGRSNDIVYEAIDPSIGRRIALKELMMPDKAEGVSRRDRIERFRREGRAAGRLAHPNIVTVYEVGVENDRYFIAMELLDGQNLRDALKARGMLPINDAVSYTIQLCGALSYAHKQGVIHRDIKPDNVQILPGNHVKLTDFGIARLAGESNLTQDGQIFGTPSYMSPEQISGKPLDARSDIFSTGVLLFEMVTGQKPFTGDGIVAITYAIMNTEPIFPPGIPQYIVDIIKKAITKDPEDRYSDIAEMENDLREQKTLGVQPPSTDTSDSVVGEPAQQTPYQQPNNQQAQAPSGKYIPSSVPWTPYGTPLPTADPTSPPSPDPVSIRDMRATVPPPILSAPTRSFLGLLMLIIGLIGIAAFFAWSLSVVYDRYNVQAATDKASRYFQQAERQFAQGNFEGAIKQWDLARQTTPDLQMSMMADEYIYQATVRLGDQAINNGDFAVLPKIARRLLDQRDNSSEGYYFLGVYYEHNQRFKDAQTNYQLAIRNNNGGASQKYVDLAIQKLRESSPTIIIPRTFGDLPDYIPAP